MHHLTRERTPSLLGLACAGRSDSRMRAQIASATHQVARWRGQLLDLLFPVRCVNCRRVGESFCPSCRSQIQYVASPVCARCSHPLRFPGEPCPQARMHSRYLDQMHAVGYHEGALREAIHALKYSRRTELAVPLGGLLQQHIPQTSWKIDVITAVPLHPDRRRQRGYNQAELLARELAGRVGLPYVEGLRRLRATADQIGLDAAARRENVRDAFEADASAFRDRHVLMIDDVCTTGATMDACAMALRAQGARSIYGLAIARPR